VKNKIVLEEHFATADTISDSQEYSPPTSGQNAVASCWTSRPSASSVWTPAVLASPSFR
jgi:hypothetical protein